jgi:catechol 2,3-dioxygenase-like lactoylglutathione lyase family enzyme
MFHRIRYHDRVTSISTLIEEVNNMFDKLALVSIPVTDQQVAKSFYTDMLGAKVVQEMPFGTPDTMWIRLALPEVATELVLATWFPQMQPGCIQGMVLTTKDIAKTHAELTKRGLRISAIQNQPWGQEATFNDPDGNGWVLQQSS